jgi:hypothetical protein
VAAVWARARVVPLACMQAPVLLIACMHTRV